MVKRIFLSALAGLLTALALGAPSAAADESLSLDQAVSLALARNPAVLQAGSRLEAARGRSLQLAARPNPELALSAEGLPLGNGEGEKEISLGVLQLLEFPGKRALRIRAGEWDEEAAAADLERVRTVTAARTEAAYLDAVYAGEVVRALEAALATLDEFRTLAAAKFKVGQASYLDVVRSRLELLRLQNDIYEARRDHRARLTALNILVGTENEAPFALTTPLDFVPLTRSLEEWRAGLARSSSLRSLEARRRQAEAVLALAKKSRLPDLGAGLFYPSKRFKAWGFEFSLALPIGSAAYRGAEVEAAAALAEAETEFRARRLRAEVLLRRIYADAETLAEQLRVFEGEVLVEVEASLETALANYEFGRAEALDILDLFRSGQDVRLEYLRALRHYRVALTELRTVGEAEELALDGE
ncbi:MAG: TolC family protein [Candidatus Aminicenantes bacterium]|nr:TolC family protein [Candidatus Aminicenantes bacterium]